MLKERAKQKAKSRAKQKVRSTAKTKIREHTGEAKVLDDATGGGAAYQGGKNIHGNSPAGSGGDMATQLQQLAQLHDSGALTDEEFASAKQRALAGR